MRKVLIVASMLAALVAAGGHANAANDVGNRKAVLLHPLNDENNPFKFELGEGILIKNALVNNAGYAESDVVLKSTTAVNLDFLKSGLKDYGVITIATHGDALMRDYAGYKKDLYRVVDGKAVAWVPETQATAAKDPRTADDTGEPYSMKDGRRFSGGSAASATEEQWEKWRASIKRAHIKGPTFFYSGQNFGCTTCGSEASSDDLQNLAVIMIDYGEPTPRYGITPRFVEKYVKDLPNSLVFAGFCYSTASPLLGQSFLNAGAGHYIGFNGYVLSNYAKGIAEQFFNSWTQSGKTVKDAFKPDPEHDGYKVLAGEPTPGGGIFAELAQRGDASVSEVEPAFPEKAAGGNDNLKIPAPAAVTVNFSDGQYYNLGGYYGIFTESQTYVGSAFATADRGATMYRWSSPSQSYLPMNGLSLKIACSNYGEMTTPLVAEITKMNDTVVTVSGTGGAHDGNLYHDPIHWQTFNLSSQTDIKTVRFLGVNGEHWACLWDDVTFVN